MLFATRTFPNCSQKVKPCLPPMEPPNTPGDDVNMDGSDQVFGDGRVISGIDDQPTLCHDEYVVSLSHWNTPFRVKVDHYGKACDATLDTGASLSAVQSEVVQTIPRGDTRLKPWFTPPIQLVDGESCCPLGVIWLSLGFIGQHFYHRFAVLQSLSSPVILGMDFMLRSPVTLHAPSRTVVLGDEPVPFEEFEDVDLMMTSSDLLCLSSVLLPCP